ncbi:hypothetical protein [Actinoplanes sp. URMC 104]|uniref:hypothetical protein n=1 Tax=Actinoplanes sp. URMC 104 TaxID=3423409 RepID=UPI003F19BA64
MTPARSLAASVVALGFASALTAPQPALAAPGPCDQPGFAAQSGAELLRINRLEVRTTAPRRSDREGVPGEDGEDDTADRAAQGEHTDTSGAGGGEPVDEGSEDDDERGPRTSVVQDVRVGEARTAMIGSARIASAAYARMLDGYPGDKASGTYASLVKPLLQKAPPTNAEGARRTTPAGRPGPLRLGRGRLDTHARWDAGMACGQVVGETGRAEAELGSVGLLKSVVSVPGGLTSRGTTALEHRAGETRTVARSTFAAERIDLAGGRIRLRVLQAPTLEAAMSAAAGGKVDYRPAIVEVSGEGIATQRLDAAGEHVDVALTPDAHATESAPLTEPVDVGGLRKAKPLGVPAVPGLPSVTDPEPESAPTTGGGIRLRLALGDVRHAVRGQAIAARATAVKVSLSQATASGNSYGGTSAVSLTMSLGVLEAAAVSLGPKQRASPATAGSGGGLPVTGARLNRLAWIGGGLILVGIAAVLAGLRRRRSRV